MITATSKELAVFGSSNLTSTAKRQGSMTKHRKQLNTNIITVKSVYPYTVQYIEENILTRIFEVFFIKPEGLMTFIEYQYTNNTRFDS